MEFVMYRVEDQWQRAMYIVDGRIPSPTMRGKTASIDYREETIVLPWTEVSFNDICRIAEEIHYYKEAMK